MTKVTQLYRSGHQWFRIEDAPATATGCGGCFFYGERIAKGLQYDVSACDGRPCVPEARADRRTVVFKLIPEVTSKRIRVAVSGPVFITQDLPTRLWKTIKDTRIIPIK